MRNKRLCYHCQMRMVEYRTSTTGKPLKHGVCRDCYEKHAARHPGSKCPRGGRTAEQKELTHETKFGTGHG